MSTTTTTAIATETTEKKVYDYTTTNLSQMNTWSIKFGKHKGSTFGKILEQDPEYCMWIVSKFDKADALVQFITRSLTPTLQQVDAK